MFFLDTKRHHLPHIHVEHGDMKAVFSIEDGEILASELSRQKVRLVQAWIELHREELLADWNLAIEGSELFRIEPLK